MRKMELFTNDLILRTVTDSDIEEVARMWEYPNTENRADFSGRNFFGNKFVQVLLLLVVAMAVEISLFQASFWSTFFAKGTDVSAQMEVICRYVQLEDMETAAVGEQDGVYVDERGFTHWPEGSALLRLTGLNREVSRIHVALDIPEGYLVKATVFAQDEGNRYIYQLGEGRVLLKEVRENGWLKIYPYGKVKNLYIRLDTADKKGEAAAGAMGDLVCNLEGAELNGRIPFAFKPVRMLLLYAVLLLFWMFRESSVLVAIPFEAKTQKGRRKRLAAAVLYAVLLVVLAAFFVRINPSCQKNLALHHAQYQELAKALAEGETSVGEAAPALLEVENPYDTINLLANQIHYQADYAYYEGKYYVYFGIVPELLLYFPYYLLTGQDLPNYQAVFVFYAGFILASAGLVYELMKRFFKKAPFYLYGIGVFMLTGSYSYYYLLLRPDLYHVPIAASCMFTAAGLWFYLAGLNRSRGRALLYAAGSLCLALTAGCRPQFVLFAVLALPLFWKEFFEKKEGVQSGNSAADASGKKRAKQRKIGQIAALAAPYFIVAAGLMYYNAVRFGSPFDFGASYSMTSNDMTHRGFNLERILYGMWYFLFQPAHLEAEFPYLRSAAIETDYLGKMVSESCFGGIFACSLLTLPVFFFHKLRRQFADRAVWWTGVLAALTAVTICAVDATGAGILQRYSSDISFGIFFAAMIMLFALAEWAKEKSVTGAFFIWLKAALLLHLAFLFLILIQSEGSTNLLTGNPVLYYKIQAMLRI